MYLRLFVLSRGIDHSEHILCSIHLSVTPRIARFQDAFVLQSIDVQLRSAVRDPKELCCCRHCDKRLLHETICEPERERRCPGLGLQLQMPRVSEVLQ